VRKVRVRKDRLYFEKRKKGRASGIKKEVTG
jgi:hypothetical protein